ncbi:MAG: hypothetical protein HC905_06190, partial [Bacteroidales bacterium]|nr:hypothetical protein [Bacteroidales bacterium]
MKKFTVHKNIERTPTLFGLPMQAGGVFFGVSVLNAIFFIFLGSNPLVKLAGIAVVPVTLYIVMLVFFNRYSFESFYKSIYSKLCHGHQKQI